MSGQSKWRSSYGPFPGPVLVLFEKSKLSSYLAPRKYHQIQILHTEKVTASQREHVLWEGEPCPQGDQAKREHQATGV